MSVLANTGPSRLSSPTSRTQGWPFRFCGATSTRLTSLFMTFTAWEARYSQPWKQAYLNYTPEYKIEKDAKLASDINSTRRRSPRGTCRWCGTMLQRGLLARTSGGSLASVGQPPCLSSSPPSPQLPGPFSPRCRLAIPPWIGSEEGGESR